jgi:pyruvate formate-lyase/glycerol dehydratase family glycyl radical enzyme
MAMASDTAKVNGRVDALRRGMLATPSICIERALWMTEAYRENEDEPAVMRRAKGLAKVLENLTVHIEEGELIVGNATGKVRGGQILPEVDWHWLLEELDTLPSREWNRYAPFSDEEKAALREFLPYWKGKAIVDKWWKALPTESRELMYVIHPNGGFAATSIYPGHCVPDFEKVLRLGLRGIQQQAKERTAGLSFADISDFRKYQFYQAVDIALEAAVGFAGRHAALARELAAKEQDPQRRAELLEIAETCERVPANPARSFREAVQSIFLVYVPFRIEGDSFGISFGRADQYLYPFYKADLEAGRITREEARELLALLFIKVNGTLVPQCDAAGPTFGGYPLTCVFTLGGVDREGKDAVNELSYVFLDAQEDAALPGDDIAVRVHKDTPDDFLLHACEVAKKLTGKFKWISDKTTIKQLLADGKPLELARDYSVEGCFQPTVGGCSQDLPGGPFNIPLMLELALNDGVSRLSGRQIGPRTGDPRRFESYEELWEAYKRQVEALLPHCLLYKNLDMELYRELAPVPFQSALFQGCIEKGMDLMEGGTLYRTHATLLGGAPTVGDSLAALKKAVFEDRRLTMAQVVDALDKNFEGCEEVLHVLSSAPKFGNDDDYVDSIVNDVIVHGSNEIAKVPCFSGGRSTTAGAIVTANIPLGKVVGALPDGRKAGEALSEGGLSPYQGRNVSGSTATLNSVAKLDHVKMTGGSVFNMRVNPALLKNEENKRRFVSLIKTYCETGGFHVQFNFADTATLLAAQKNPAEYRDLLVRVATYSARFVELSPELQNDIIRRIQIEDL